MQKKARTGSGKSFDSAWKAILGVTGLVVVAVCLVLWLLFRNDAPQADEAPVSAAESEETTEAETEEAAGAPQAPRLVFPINVTVAAGGDGLQGFRVTELPNERHPVWVESGESVTFSSDRGVILWGEGAEGMNPDEVTLRFQGYEWKPPTGQILRIDSTYGQVLLDSLHAVFPDGGRSFPSG